MKEREREGGGTRRNRRKKKKKIENCLMRKANGLRE